MPRLSLYRPEKANDYTFFDRTIKEQFTVGGTDLLIHKYLGSNNPPDSKDLTQPHYDTIDPTKIQDLLFLENRNRTYDPNVYRVRGHYNVANLDFDLSQFGLFLTNDVIFVTVHYNNMIDVVGRKLMVGDVFELPHLIDYHPLDDTVPVGLRRFYQITDANFASEGFSQTWFPHLWRIKCEPLINSQEFNDILKEPINQDTYLGDWDPNTAYEVGYTVTDGGKIFTPKIPVPPGIPTSDTHYWKQTDEQNLIDIMTTYNQNIAINQAVIDEAKRVVPKIGYDRSQLYIVPTYVDGEPAPPVDVLVGNEYPSLIRGNVTTITDPNYRKSSTVLRIPQGAFTVEDAITAFTTLSLQLGELAPERLDTGSGQVSGDLVVTATNLGPAITGPYGTADNTYATADQFVNTVAAFQPTPINSYVVGLVSKIDNNIAVGVVVRATVFSENGLPQSVFAPNTRITAINRLTNSITVSSPTLAEVPGSTQLEVAYDFKGGYKSVTSMSTPQDATKITLADYTYDLTVGKVIRSSVNGTSAFKFDTIVADLDTTTDGQVIMTVNNPTLVPLPQDTRIEFDFGNGQLVDQSMDFRADCDPRFQFIRRYTPRNFGYITGYDSGNTEAPNGEPIGTGITFPAKPQVGDYFLRIDYLPQKLFRWSGTMWVEISQNVRTDFGMDADSQSQRSRFVNDVAERTRLTSGQTIPTRQSLSDALRVKPD